MTPPTNTALAEAQAFLEANPDVTRVETLLFGMVGGAKGKWLPRDGLISLAKGGARMPLSSATNQPMGQDIQGFDLIDEYGDPDGILVPIPDSLCRVPWADEPTVQVQVTMNTKSGLRSPYVPRNALERQVERLKSMGYTACVATEFEFYLIDPDISEGPKPPAQLGAELEQVYDLDNFARYEPFLKDLRTTCVAQGLPYEGAFPEYGPGQFEVNLTYQDCPLKAGDQGHLLKRAIRHVARAHEFEASFMAKPYWSSPGSGLHVHASLFDQQGVNIFDTQGRTINAPMQAAIRGLMDSMDDLQLIFAPHMNSYKRFQPGSYAPTRPTWAYDHRGSAIRVPSTDGLAARVEHRISGSDANPHLVIAAVLGSIADGLERGLGLNAAPLKRMSDADDVPALTPNWEVAIDAFENSSLARQIFGNTFVDAYVLARRDELARARQELTPFEIHTYLTRI